jgi:hypothetical protein
MQKQSLSSKSRSALSFYSQEIRSQVRQEIPELNIMEISKEIAKRWKKVPKSIKKVYEKKATADKDRVDKLYPLKHI